MRCARAVIAFAVTLLAAALPGAGGTAQRPRWRSVEVQGAGVNVRAAPSARAPRRGPQRDPPPGPPRGPPSHPPPHSRSRQPDPRQVAFRREPAGRPVGKVEPDIRRPLPL